MPIIDDTWFREISECNRRLMHDINSSGRKNTLRKQMFTCGRTEGEREKRETALDIKPFSSYGFDFVYLISCTWY